MYGEPPLFPAIFIKENNLCDILFASLEDV